MNMYKDDPWDWTKGQQSATAPLSAQLKPSMEQPGGAVQPGPLTQQLSGMMLGKGIDATAKGLEAGYKTATATQAPLAATPAASMVPSAAAEGLAASGLPGVTTAASMVPGTLATGAAAADAVGTGAALGAGAEAGATGAAMAGGEAALAAMGPVGWAIGAGLLAKKLGIF